MPDFNDRPCAGKTLDRLIQPAILIVLSKGPLHGYAVAEKIGQRLSLGGRPPDISGVYRFLNAMETKGLVDSSWDTSHVGPARRRYEITSEGRRCLKRWVKTLQQYRKGISALVRLAQAARQKGAQARSVSRC